MVLAVDLDDLAHDLQTLLRDVVEAANERADDISASERREERLIGAEAEGDVRPNLLLLQPLDRRPAIGRLRDKLGDDPERPRYIQTERGLGYRFLVC